MSSIKHSDLIAIIGPTASGKSSIAIEIARAFSGEIISVDSRQVYRHMDIGTGKVPRDPLTDNTSEIGYVSEGIRHLLLDIVEPTEHYTISHFLHDARTAINSIRSRGNYPILCGGTGFWMQTLIEDMPISPVPPNPELRKSLGMLSTQDLFETLERIDPSRAKTIDQRNTHRLIRAIEIAKGSNSSGEEHHLDTAEVLNSRFSRSLILALCPSKETLDSNIRIRLDDRFNHGMTEEIETLHKGHGVSWKRLDDFGLEYRWISRYLRGEISMSDMKQRLFFDIVHYAKRQITWIRRWKKINPNIRIFETPEEILNAAREYFEKRS